MRINKNFRVKGQHITCTDDTRIIKGNKNLYYAVFHVDELWDGIELKACFTVDEEPYIMPLERIGKTLECEIPYPANSGVVFGVGIFGGDLISTDIVYASTTPGIPIDGENPPEPVPDWFNKMEGIAKQAMETANSIKEQADSGAFNGKPFTYDDFTEEQLKSLEGKPGYTPQKNIDYFDGKDGADGKDGQNGTDGKDGYTPQKGLDYFTTEEVAEIVMAAAAEVGADPSGTAAGAVSSHNTAEDAHADIRELIEQITTGKISVSDIVDNLTTKVANKPLSAAQGVALKALIDAISVPTKVSQLENDSKYLTEHQDLTPYAKTADLTAHTGNTTVHITAAERTKWNGKSDFSGSYNDLSDKPTIPTVPSNISAFTNDAGYLTQHQDISGKANASDLTAHTENTTVHITAEERTKWDAYEEQIANLKSGIDPVPDYWLDELDSKADAIQTAMEKAGMNKSAFLWYSDAHWANGNSKMSPCLLNYLYRNTPMNKVNFGGDIIGDSLLSTREEMKYLYEWRLAIKDLPNHHSCEGNHDVFASDAVDYEGANYTYTFLIAPEESPDMVMGDSGNYYYIDNPSEKTRYLYFAFLTSDLTAMLAQGQFMCDAMIGVPTGWHIVAISHSWWGYSSASNPTAGAVPAYMQEILDVFDAYNSRGTWSASNYFTSQDFTNAKGKVEFCIGGHIHVDYDFSTSGGIPVIITTSDTNQNRVPDSTVDCGTLGTITEAAVYGIIADYNEDVTKITVVGIGRGTSRVVRASTVMPTSISDISYSGDTTIESAIDKAKFSFTVNYSDGSTSSATGANTVSPSTIEVVGNNTVTITYVENGVTLTGTVTVVGTAKPTVNLFDKNDPDVLLRGRINSSGNAVEYADNQVLSGYIEAKPGETFTVTSDKANNANPYTGSITAFNADKTYMVQMNKDWTGLWNWNDDYLTGTLTIPTGEYNGVDFASTAYVRVCMAYYDLDNIVIIKS